MICFRADGNAHIGSGHIMRCLSLAAALRTLGEDCLFAMADDTMAATVRSRGFEVRILGTYWRDMYAELPVFLPLAAQARLVVVDSYALTPAWLEAVRQQVPVAQFDDEDAFLSTADFLINYNLSGLDRPYDRRYAGQPVRLLLGPAYAPLREEFCTLPDRPVRQQVTDILVSTGGADPENVAGRFVETLACTPGWESVVFHLVAGALNPRLPELERAAAALPNLELHRNVQQMAALICRCDAAVAAAGSTLYELCACGTPTVTYVLADNQLPGATAFARRGLMLNAGDCRRDEGFYPRLLQTLRTLCDDAPRRAAMASAMRHTVDGRGAHRLAAALLE